MLLSTLSLKVCSICKIIYIYIYIYIYILSKCIIQFINIAHFHKYSALDCHSHDFLAFLHFHTHHLEDYLAWCTRHCHNIEVSSARILHNSHLYKNKYLQYIDKKRKHFVIDSRASIKILLITKPTTPYHSPPYHKTKP